MFREIFEGKSVDDRRSLALTIRSDIQSGKLQHSAVSIRDLAEGLLGADTVRKCAKSDYADITRSPVFESADPVNTRLFLDITGQILLTGALQGYQAPGLIGSQLVTEETDTIDGGRKPGLSEIDDDALVVKENEEYPTVKFGEDYIDLPYSQKRGLRVAMTKEAIFFDRTGLMLSQAQKIGERLALNKERRILSVVLGLTNTYVRKGVARNTYVASGDPRINKKTGMALTDWTTLESAELLFAAMRDDRAKAEPIIVTPNTLLVMPAKLHTARRILTATEIRTGSQTGNVQTYSPNPVAGSPVAIQMSQVAYGMLTDALGDASAAADYWYYGNPKRAFRYRTLMPFNVQAAPAGHDDEFDKDIVAQFKASERGVAYVEEPWQMAEFTG